MAVWIKKLFSPHQIPAFGRVLALALACLLVLMIPVVADDNIVGNMHIYVFHDRNGNGIYDAGVDNHSLTGFARLGFSSESGDKSVSVTTTLDPLTSWNTVSAAMPVGSWRMNTIVAPDGYVLTETFGVLAPNAGALVAYKYADRPSIPVEIEVGTRLYIPVVLAAPDATLSGRVVWADDGGAGVTGAVATLLNQNGQAVSPAKTYTVGADGSYRFTGLSPGVYKVKAALSSTSGALQYSSTSQTGGNITLLDGQDATAPTFTMGRSAWVRFRFMGNQVAEYGETAYGSAISEPTLSSSVLNSSTVKRTVTGWYTDEALTQKWSFSTDTVKANTTLYAQYSTTYTPESSSDGSSGSGSRGTTKADVSKPDIKSVKGTVSGNTITLTVTMSGGLPIFEYQWQMRNANGIWEDIVGATKQKATLSGAKAGTVYEFRVYVVRDTDGGNATSTTVKVTVPEDDSSMPTMATDYSQSPPAASQAGGSGATGTSAASAAAPTLSLSSKDFIFEGGRLVVTPSVSGGSWGWDEAMLAGEAEEGGKGDDVVLTGLKSGKATISYTANGKTVTAEIEIRPAVLPATGQSITSIAVLSLIGAALLAAALPLYLRRRKETDCGE